MDKCDVSLSYLECSVSEVVTVYEGGKWWRKWLEWYAVEIVKPVREMLCLNLKVEQL
jgi:hypothetical protein